MFSSGLSLLLTLSLVFFLSGSWILSFTSLDEGRNMGAVLHMLSAGDLVSPQYNCQPRFEKPPLLYWLVAGSFLLLGLNEFSARLISGLSATGVVVLTYLVARDFFSREIALKSGMILITFPHLWVESRAVVPEMLNTFFALLGLYLFLKGRFTMGWLSLALTFLTKGPVGVVLAVGIYLLWKRRLDFLELGGILLFLTVGFSWYVAMFFQHGYEYFYRFFIYENLMRYTGERSTHPAPFYYYLPVIALGTLWYVPLYLELFRKFRREWIPLLLWSVFVVLFFSLASNKLHHYILLAYPALAILFAHVTSYRYLLLSVAVSLTALSLVLFALYFYEGQRFTPKAYSLVKSYAGSVQFYRAEDSALVFYSGRCIKTLENPLDATGLIITKEKYRRDFPQCRELLRGREFDGVYLLLECGSSTSSGSRA